MRASTFRIIKAIDLGAMMQAAFFLALFLFARDLTGQAPQRITVDPSPSCPECKLELQRIVILPIAEDYIPLGVWAVDGKGRWFTVTKAADGRVGVYDKAGRFLQFLGRRGRGPGEYENVQTVAIGPGDSIYVNDNALQRISVFSPSLKYVRSISIGVNAMDLFVAYDGGFLAPIFRGGAQLFDPASGSVTREFSPGEAPPDCRLWTGVWLTDRGRVWLTEGTRLTTTEFDLSGKRLREINTELP
jgi:hypothetical protein